MLSYFRHVLNAEPNTQVDSNVVVLDKSGVLSIDSGILFVNGVALGLSAPVKIGDVVSLRLISGNEGDGVLVSYYLGADSGVWAVASPGTKLFFDFAQPFSVKAFAICRSTPVYIDVAQDFLVQTTGQNSKILINGVASGSSATIGLNDKLEIEYIAPETFETEFQVSVLVGSNLGFIKSKTAPKDLFPSPIVFDSMLGVVASSVCTSNEVLISSIDDVIDASSDAIIVKNGIEVGFATQVTSGDRIKLRATASSKSNTFQFYYFAAGARKTSWSIRTASSSLDQITRPEFLYNHPFQSATFAADFSANRFVKIAQDTVLEYAFVTPTQAESKDSHVFVADFFQDRLFVMDKVSGNTLFSISIGSKPYSATFSPRQSGEDVVTEKFVTLSGSDQVAVLDSQEGYAIKKLISVPGRPMGIDSDFNGALWVASFDTGVVTKIDPTDYSISSFSIGGKPLEVFCADNSVYVSDVANRRVIVLSTDGQIVSQYKTGSNPWGMTKNGVFLYVADSADNTITEINTLSHEQRRIRTGSRPSSVAFLNGHLYVACSGSTVVQKIDAVTGDLVENIALSRRPSALTTDGQSVFVALTYNSELSQVGFDSQAATQLSISPVLDSPLSTSMESAPITIPIGRRLYVPEVDGISIKVDGIPVPNGTFVYPEDTVTIAVKSSPNTGETDSIPIFFGEFQNTLSVSTIKDSDPDPVYFSSWFNQFLGAEIVSNEAVISGLSEGATTNINLDAPGYIRVNGVEFFNSAVVKNGDLVSVRLNANAPYGSIQTYHLLHNAIPFGSLRVHMLTLNGPAPHDDFNLWLAKVDAQFIRYDSVEYESIDSGFRRSVYDSAQSSLGSFSFKSSKAYLSDLPGAEIQEAEIYLTAGKSSKFRSVESSSASMTEPRKLTQMWANTDGPSFSRTVSQVIAVESKAPVEYTVPKTYFYRMDRSFGGTLENYYPVDTNFLHTVEEHQSVKSFYTHILLDQSLKVDVVFSSRPFWPMPATRDTQCEKIGAHSYQFEHGPMTHGYDHVFYEILPIVRDLHTIVEFDSHHKWKDINTIVEFSVPQQVNGPINSYSVGRSFVKKITQVCNFRRDALQHVFPAYYLFGPSFDHRIGSVKRYDPKPFKIDFDFDESAEKACGLNGLFISEADARLAGQSYSGASPLKLAKCWTWIVPSDQSIVCLVPSKEAGVYRVGGYLSGG